MNEFKSFRQRMTSWNFSDIARIIVILYLMAMASAVTNRPSTDMSIIVDEQLHVTVAAQAFLFNFCFMGAVGTYLLVDRTWVLMFWLTWPLVFNSMAVWQVIASPEIANAGISTSAHNAVNGAFVFILLTVLIVITEIFEQRQAAMLQRVIGLEKDCNERIASASPKGSAE